MPDATLPHSDRALTLPVDDVALDRAAAILAEGGLVAVPTETVYGLAARADDELAVARIYAAKGRPSFNPLIVHVFSVPAAASIARFDARAEQLAERFWPGPLTMVLPIAEGAKLASPVTAGLSTVAVRCPAHSATRALLDRCAFPLAAPSANRSGGVSPTTAEHVQRSLGDRVDLILDGGASEEGLESTIVAVREGGWDVLRPGPLNSAIIAEQIGPEQAPHDRGIEAPGQLSSHYAPGKPLRLNAQSAGADEFMIGFGAIAGDVTLSEMGSLAIAAARLYSCLHWAAASPRPRIAVAPIPEEDLGIAINDRLRRAAA